MQPKIPTDELQTPYERALDHAALTASLTVRIDKVPAGKRLRIDSVQYVNPTGLATDAANYFTAEVKKNVGGVAKQITEFVNTNAAGGAAVAADTWTDATLTATGADRVLAGSDTLDLVFTKAGTQTLPAGHLVLRGRYV